MTSLFTAQNKAADRERAAMIKRRVSCADAVAALGLDTDAGVECPTCHALGALAVSKSGESAHCESCATTFDAIALVRAARGLSFNGACRYLEELCLPARDDKTGRLL